MTAVARVARVAAFVVALPLLAGCTASDSDAPDSSAVATDDEPSAPVAEAPFDVYDLRVRARAFDDVVDIPGFRAPPSAFTPVDSALNYYGSATTVVEPATCAAFHSALDLGTDADLTTASQDMINPVGPLFPGGRWPLDGEPFEYFSVMTRVFGDEDLAATVRDALLDSGCRVYTMTGTWAGGSSTQEGGVSDVTLVDLPGLDTSTVRITMPIRNYVDYDLAGEVLEQDHIPAESDYVHVEGPYAIAVRAVGLEADEATVARVIADFLAHMSAD